MRRKLLVLPVLVGGMIGLSHGQPPGGGGPGGGGMRFGGGSPDPETIWGFVSKGQPSINLNDPANARTKDRMLKDGTPVPADGILTKEAFKANFQASMDKRMAGGGAVPGQPMVVTMGGPGGGGRGGFDPSAMPDEQIQGMMRRMDTDGDGRISAVEATASGRLAPDQFAQYDTNRDGFIDTAEYRVYLTARTQQRAQEQGQGGVPAGPMPQFQPLPQQTPSAPAQPTADEPSRPEVWRYGKLPKGAPSWMLAPSSSNKDGLDADRDGQVGLYEWRRAGKRTSEFVAMDLNGDGYLTYVEWKTYNERLADQQKADDPDAPAPTVIITPAGGPPAAGGDRGARGERGPKGERKGPTRNPFANGSKGG